MILLPVDRILDGRRTLGTAWGQAGLAEGGKVILLWVFFEVEACHSSKIV